MPTLKKHDFERSGFFRKDFNVSSPSHDGEPQKEALKPISDGKRQGKFFVQVLKNDDFRSLIRLSP